MLKSRASFLKDRLNKQKKGERKKNEVTKPR